MNNKPVIWSPDAEEAYLDILSNVATGSVKMLDELIGEVQKITKLIEQFNSLGESCKGRPLRRIVIFKKFLLIYRIGSQYVEIVDFVYTGSDHQY